MFTEENVNIDYQPTSYIPPAEDEPKKLRVPEGAVEDPPELVEHARILLEAAEGVDRLAAEKKIFELTDPHRKGGYLSALTAFRLTKKPTYVRPKEEPITPATPSGDSTGQGDAEMARAKAAAIQSILEWERKRLAGELGDEPEQKEKASVESEPAKSEQGRRADLLDQIEQFEKEHTDGR